MIVTFVVVAMVAGAGVFEVVAGGAVAEVQVELGANFLGVRLGLDGDNNREVVAFWEG